MRGVVHSASLFGSWERLIAAPRSVWKRALDSDSPVAPLSYLWPLQLKESGLGFIIEDDFKKAARLAVEHSEQR